MNNIISRIENILAADGWKRTAMLQVFLDELKEKREAALKNAPQAPILPSEPFNEDDSVNPRNTEEMIKDGQLAVATHFPE